MTIFEFFRAEHVYAKFEIGSGAFVGFAVPVAGGYQGRSSRIATAVKTEQARST